MKKLHILSLLVTISLFLPCNISAAGFFKGVKGCALPAYKAKSILAGSALTGYYAYEKLETNKSHEKTLSEVEYFCKTESKATQKDFRNHVKSLIPAYEFERLNISNPLKSFFVAYSHNTTAASLKNNSKNLILLSPVAIKKFDPIDFVLRHEIAHILLGHHDEQKKADKEVPLKNCAAAGLLTTYRIKGNYSASAAQVFKKNISSCGLFSCYALYNQYKHNQLIRKGEYEADAFALKHTHSVKELEKGIDILHFCSQTGERNMIKNMLKVSGLPEKVQHIVIALSNSDFYNECFVTHPKVEERVAKIQEKIDFLKAQEAQEIE